MSNNSTTSSQTKFTGSKDVPVLEVTIVLAILIVLSVLGNSLVCYAFVIQPRLRRVLYYPVLNLAVADILCGLVAMTSYLAKKHVFGGEWERLVCDVSRFSYFVTEYASILSLAVISVERTMAIFRPLAHATGVTSRRMKTALALVWCDAVAVAALPFFWRSTRGPLRDAENCSFRPTKSWSVMVITSNVLLPFLLILLNQTAIYFIAVKHSVLINHQTRAAARSGDDEVRRRWRQSLKVRPDAWQMERKATITLSVVVGLFFVCWGPSSVYYFVKTVRPKSLGGAFWKRREGLFNAVVKLLTFANSCFNPVVYAWLNNDFRNAFRRVLSRRLYASAVQRRASTLMNESISRKRSTAENGDSKV